ncbi:hypothetical protein AURDEDRAFT_126749 [Auricularia subglabra TFB-10046 SS5]|nr:hypothetical protein AURDEDRAFT_126749 [Auricularia subglabra TFB-10046 SS5]
MTDLPPELLYEILPQCDNDALCSVARVSKKLYGIADRLLYEFIHLDSTARCADLLAAIDANDESARHGPMVRGLRLMGARDRNLCTELLVKLTGLKRLNVTLWCEGFSRPATGFSFRLRRLRIYGECDNLAAAEFIAFLEEQVELEVLELVASKPGERRTLLCERAGNLHAATLLPRLKSLQAPLDIILSFLSRHRPVLEVIKVQTWTHEVAPESHGEDVASALCPAIAAAAVNLRALMLGTVNAVDTIQLVATTCPQLQLLELLVYRRKTFEKFVYQSPVLNCTPAFSRVKRFVLHVVGTPYEETLDDQDITQSFESNIVPGLHRLLTSLKDCELTLHAAPDNCEVADNNPTFFNLYEYLRTPSTYVPDWHTLPRALQRDLGPLLADGFKEERRAGSPEIVPSAAEHAPVAVLEAGRGLEDTLKVQRVIGTGVQLVLQQVLQNLRRDAQRVLSVPGDTWPTREKEIGAEIEARYVVRSIMCCWHTGQYVLPEQPY